VKCCGVASILGVAREMVFSCEYILFTYVDYV